MGTETKIKSLKGTRVTLADQRSREAPPDTTAHEDIGTAGEDAAAVLAHELRGPLAVVNGYLDVLRRAEDQETREYALGAAQRAIGRMDALIDDVLESASRSRADDAALERIDPVVVVRTLLDDVPSYRRRVEFSSSCRSRVRARALTLSRALSNVLDNALKFSPAATTVHVMLVDEDGTVRFIIDDEGPGIPSDEVLRLRRRFERLDRDAAVPGYGMGLGIAVELVEALDGEVVLGNRPDGKGARVELSLPVAVEDQAPTGNNG